jgi:eukaryotic-like serine/threonine-protein kinase
MEFLEGETLAERIRKGAVPLNEILKIGIAVGEALAVAHRQGIVHRDLKPEMPTPCRSRSCSGPPKMPKL